MIDLKRQSTIQENTMKQTKQSDKKVKVQCQVCGKNYLVPQSSWDRWKEENTSNTDRGDVGYTCNSCGDRN